LKVVFVAGGWSDFSSTTTKGVSGVTADVCEKPGAVLLAAPGKWMEGNMAARVKSGGLDFYKARCSVLQGELEELRTALGAAGEAWYEKYRALEEMARRSAEEAEEFKTYADQAVELRRQVFVLEKALLAQLEAHSLALLDLASQVSRGGPWIRDDQQAKALRRVEGIAL
jgi:hypothetical protein